MPHMAHLRHARPTGHAGRMGKCLVVVLGLLLGTACESAEAKCLAERGAAVGEWNGYILALEQARARALEAQTTAAIKLRDDIDKRLLPVAQQRADGRYPRSSEAWLRASKSAYNDLCAADREGSVQKRNSLEAEVELGDVDERLALARLARDAADGDVEAAARASAAAILHPEYPQLKQAQARVSELRERCQQQPAERDEAVSSAVQP
jgi:hypothetical protein